MFYIYFNGEFHYVSDCTHYKHGAPVGSWYPDRESALIECRRLNCWK